MVRNYKRKTVDRWTTEHLLKALESIRDKKKSINECASVYGISRATLYRHYQKFIVSGANTETYMMRTCGGNPILTRTEEDVLEKTIMDLREQGFQVSSSDIKRICFEYVDTNGIHNQFNREKRQASDDWYYGFLKRHPGVRTTPEKAKEKEKKNKNAKEIVDETIDAVLAEEAATQEVATEDMEEDGEEDGDEDSDGEDEEEDVDKDSDRVDEAGNGNNLKDDGNGFDVNALKVEGEEKAIKKLDEDLTNEDEDTQVLVEEEDTQVLGDEEEVNENESDKTKSNVEDDSEEDLMEEESDPDDDVEEEEEVDDQSDVEMEDDEN